MNKSVSFTSNFFIEIQDNLFISDQIASFDEKLIKKHNINCLINLTKNAPFLFNFINIKVNFSSNFFKKVNQLHLNSEVQTICSKINSIVKTIHKLLLSKKNVLIYCDNGSSKTIPILLCYYIKYPFINSIDFKTISNTDEKSHQSLNLPSIESSVLNYLKPKINSEILNEINNLYICKHYREYLLQKNNQKIILNYIKNKIN